jgi:hypothetical protein
MCAGVWARTGVRACVRAQIKKLEAEVTELADELDLLRKENERIVLQLGTRARACMHALTYRTRTRALTQNERRLARLVDLSVHRPLSISHAHICTPSPFSEQLPSAEGPGVG